MTDIAQLIRHLSEAGTAERYDILFDEIAAAERRGAEQERARIRKDLQRATSSFIADLAAHQ